MKPLNALGWYGILFLAACGGSSAPATGTDPNACEKDKDCDVGFFCCNNFCEDLTVSMRACGSCDVACSDDTFCTGTECASFSVSSLCDNADITVLLRDAKAIDGQADDPTPDNDAAISLGESLQTICGGAPVAAAPETAVLVNNTSGPLNTGHGTVLVVAGGRVYSYVMEYLDGADVTPVELVVAADGNAFQIVSRSERRVIAVDKLANLSASRDYIIGQAIYDSTSGTQILNVYGIFRGGTTIGAEYFADLVAQSTAGGSRWFVTKLEDGSLTRLAGD